MGSAPMAEAEVGAWTPFRTRRGFGGLIAGAVIFLLIGLGLSAFAWEVGAVPLVIGIIFVVVIVLRARKPNIRYTLTNRRAVVYSTTRNGQTELQSCELRNATVSVLNRKVISQTQSRSGGGLIGAATYGVAGVMMGSGRAVSQSDQVGDVLFMVGGMPQVRFIGCPDPDGVVATATQLIAGLKGA
jgi:hypothetical protein